MIMIVSCIFTIMHSVYLLGTGAVGTNGDYSEAKITAGAYSEVSMRIRRSLTPEDRARLMSIDGGTGGCANFACFDGKAEADLPKPDFLQPPFIADLIGNETTTVAPLVHAQYPTTELVNLTVNNDSKSRTPVVRNETLADNKTTISIQIRLTNLLNLLQKLKNTTASFAPRTVLTPRSGGITSKPSVKQVMSAILGNQTRSKRQHKTRIINQIRVGKVFLRSRPIINMLRLPFYTRRRRRHRSFGVLLIPVT